MESNVMTYHYKVTADNLWHKHQASSGPGFTPQCRATQTIASEHKVDF